MNNKQQCTCENFQQYEDCEHIGNKVLEECGFINNKQSWEEEFDKNFPSYLTDICPACGKPTYIENGYWVFEKSCAEHNLSGKIKNFISDLLDQREAEIRKETIDAVMPEEKELPDYNAIKYDKNNAWNEARQSIIYKAKEKFNIDL